MSKISRYFSFPDLESKHFLFLLFFVFMICKSVVKIFLKRLQDKKKNENEKKIDSIIDDFFKLYVYLIGDFLSIIPYLIVKYRMENYDKIDDKIDDKIEKVELKNVNNINESEIIYNYYKPEKKNKCTTIFKDMLKYTIFDFIAQIGNTIYLYILYEKNSDEGQASFNSITLINIFAILIFNYIFLHERFYRHHCFALMINIICLLILTIFDIIDITKKKEIWKSIIHISIKIISNIFYSYTNVFSKIIFQNDYLTPYSLLLYKALFELVYLLIFSIIFIIIDKAIFIMFIEIFKNITKIVLMIVLIFISFFYNISILQLIDKFSPSNFIVARAFENFSSFIIDDLINGNNYNWIIISFKIIMYILIILASFIYNEFIVINICGLSKNTKLILEEEEAVEKAKNEERKPSESTEPDQDTAPINNVDEKY